MDLLLVPLILLEAQFLCYEHRNIITPFAIDFLLQQEELLQGRQQQHKKYDGSCGGVAIVFFLFYFRR